VLTVMNEPKIILGQYADQSSQQRASSNHQWPVWGANPEARARASC
jgi:hypothetical protein